MKKNQYILGFLLLAVTLYLGSTLKTGMLFFRLLIGLGFGYALTRSFMGFAGSVNRAYNRGSTKLMRALMGMFVMTALFSVAILYTGDPLLYKLKLNPINFGLIVGGLLFGFGMALSMCCASGVLTDLVTGLPRATITLFFFCMGVFLGFSPQKRAGWVKNSWFTTETGSAMKKGGGVYLPDLFKWDGLDGYLGTIILISLFALIVVWLSVKYENKQKLNNNYNPIPIEEEQRLVEEDKGITPFFSFATYEKFFVKPWSLAKGCAAITLLFTLLMGVTKKGWGVSTPLGIWFGKFLMLFGVSAERLADFTGKSVSTFTTPLLEQQSSVQNFGIVLGTIICLLLAGTFKEMATSELKITKREIFIFALGGLTMGYGTRIGNGCNAGAFYTPIANLSLSGWIYLVFLTVGGVLGNKFAKKVREL